VEHLALGDQVGDGAGGLLDGDVRVDAVLVVEVDVIGSEALQRAFDGSANVGGTAVDHPRGGRTVLVGNEPELGRDDDLVAAALNSLADDFFAVEGAVDFCGVDVGDAEVERTVDGANRLGVVEGTFAGVCPSHRHRTQTDAGDLKASQGDGLHEGLHFLRWELGGCPTPPQNQQVESRGRHCQEWYS
jgi:hypothetical protein